MFFIGGDAAALEAARPALEAVGAKINHLGPVGSGATWKLINNQLIGAQTAALAEAANLARKAGFKPEQIAALISDSSAASPIVKAKLDRMLEHNYEDTDFALYLMLKDVRYAIDLAATLGVKSDMSAAAEAAFARAKSKGLGDKDFAAVAAA
jgi:3-hydroxyisobutyrate dehydrogenase